MKINYFDCREYKNLWITQMVILYIEDHNEYFDKKILENLLPYH